MRCGGEWWTASRADPFRATTQLQEIIRERIRNGEWTPGSLIPSERELCERYGISRMTARQAISGLESEGLLYREQGKGTFVGQPVIAQQLLQLTGFTEDMTARKSKPGARVLSAEMWPADEETAERLRIRAGQPVYRLRRLRLADGEPLAVELTRVSFIGCERLLQYDLGQESLYRLLEGAFDIPLLEADEELYADCATGDEPALLQLTPGSPVLRTRRVMFTRRNHPVEYATVGLPRRQISLLYPPGARRAPACRHERRAARDCNVTPNALKQEHVRIETNDTQKGIP